MGRPIQVTAPTLINAGTSSTGWALAAAGTGPTITAMTMKDGTAGTAIRGSAASGANYRINYQPAGGIDMAAFQTFDVDIHISSPINNGLKVPLNIAFTNDSGFANHYSLAAASGGAVPQLSRGWNTLRVGRADFGVAAGAPSWSSSFNLIRFNFDLVAGQVIEASISNLRKGGFSRSQFCIMFDDGGESVYSKAFPIMEPLGIPGSNAIIGSYLAGSGTQGGFVRCTVSQFADMNSAGWDCCNHTWSHNQTTLLTATQAECYDEIARGGDAIVDNGLSVNDSHLAFCAPYGEWADNYLAAAAQYGATCFRAGLNFASSGAEMLQGDTLDATLRPLPTVVPINTSTVATLIAIADRAIASGRHIVFVFHHIVDSSADSNIKFLTADFGTFVKHLWKRRAACDCVNLSTWLERVSSPTS